MREDLTRKRQVFLSRLRAGRGQRRLALAVVLVSAAAFLGAIPFAKVPLKPVSGFIPIYQSALVINDVITAVLLFGQFGILRSRALLVLANAYLFTAFMAASHLLTFPGLLAPTGLLGAGPQSTAWLYMFWHGGFPLLVSAYAMLKRDEREASSPRAAIVLSVVAVVVAVCGLTALATAGDGALPAIMEGDHYTNAMIAVVSTVWVLVLVALAVLWRRRPHSVLDLWLMVVLCAWLFDIALSAVLNAGRFDVGFYAGRIYGLLAASFVLIVLLLENGALYTRLAKAFESERRARRRVEEKTGELVVANKELDAFSYSVSHDLRAPLRGVVGYTRMLEETYGERLDAEARRLLDTIRTSGEEMGKMIEDLLAFSRLGRQPLRTQPVQLDNLVSESIKEVRPGHDGRKIDITVGELGIAAVDPALFKHALVNLLSNAVKYTRERNPAVIEVGRREGNGGPDVYYVRDNGAGFDMAYYGKLFGVFQRLHKPEEYEGTGVGLAIVQRIVNRHGGRIWAESRLGEGATFLFTLESGSHGRA